MNHDQRPVQSLKLLGGHRSVRQTVYVDAFALLVPHDFTVYLFYEKTVNWELSVFSCQLSVSGDRDRSGMEDWAKVDARGLLW